MTKNLSKSEIKALIKNNELYVSYATGLPDADDLIQDNYESDYPGEIDWSDYDIYLVETMEEYEDYVAEEADFVLGSELYSIEEDYMNNFEKTKHDDHMDRVLMERDYWNAVFPR